MAHAPQVPAGEEGGGGGGGGGSGGEDAVGADTGTDSDSVLSGGSRGGARLLGASGVDGGSDDGGMLSPGRDTDSNTVKYGVVVTYGDAGRGR